MRVEDALRETIQSHLPPLKETPSGWRKTNCPVCIHRGHSADRRERFGVKFGHEDLGLHCFNCGFGARWAADHEELSANMKFFLQSIGVPDTDIRHLNFMAFTQHHSINAPEKELQGSITTRWTAKTLPEGATPLSVEHDHRDYRMVREYALSRRLYNLDKVYWSPEREHLISKRLLIPFYFNKKVVGWTGRLANPNVDGLRYYHEMPTDFIFGLDNQKNYDRKFTVITESPVDALMLDGVAVLNNTVNENQATLINNLPTVPLLVPDRDKAGDDLVNDAIRQGWPVSFPRWGRRIKDFGDAAKIYGVVAATRSVFETITDDPDKIKVWRKLDREKYGN